MTTDMSVNPCLDAQVATLLVLQRRDETEHTTDRIDADMVFRPETQWIG